MQWFEMEVVHRTEKALVLSPRPRVLQLPYLVTVPHETPIPTQLDISMMQLVQSRFAFVAVPLPTHGKESSGDREPLSVVECPRG